MQNANRAGARKPTRDKLYDYKLVLVTLMIQQLSWTFKRTAPVKVTPSLAYRENYRGEMLLVNKNSGLSKGLLQRCPFLSALCAIEYQSESADLFRSSSQRVEGLPLLLLPAGPFHWVILGGGRRNFRNETVTDEENSRGRRHDGRDLIQEWQEERRRRNENHAYVWNRQGLLSVPLDDTDYLLGLFESNHMQYHLQADSETEPTLAELTEVAIRMLSKNPEGFFLFVEGGRIDHAHHDNFARMALDETVEFSKAVQRAAELLSEEDSLLVVTADHSHVMSINGYSRRGRDILGLSDDRDEHGVPFMTLSYTNGPGFRSHTATGSRPDLTGEDLTHEEWRSHVDVPLDSETHGGDDVAVFARGPHHHLFTGLYEQSQLPHLMAYASCVGPGLTVCSTDGASTTAPALITLFLVMLPLCASDSIL
ncbi:Membrane-bound alkaline phosphatase [Eumeta japonica]|uniref:alkaline phosphatase n=1 Tax=Eumeta variegata TaxID=151549 RepID=A0A4C1ZHT4_EUMVA|nr:Membrane-bound alkaline phosphatase [Eumeta japonica]